MVAGAWWIVLGPMIRKPLAVAPDIDLDAAHVRDEMSSQSAKAGSPPAPIALATAAPSAPGSAAAPDHERCGFEDAPRTAPGEIRDGVIVADQMKAAGLGWVTTQARIDAALRASPDPFDHAVADLVNAGNMRTFAGRLDALVQAATASSDARIYSMAYRACYSAGHMSPIFKMPDPPVSCASLTARRWAALDPNNGVPWLWALAQASEDSDPTAQQESLSHLAAASRFDDRLSQASASVVAHAPAEGANDFATHDLAGQASSLMPSGLGPLVTICQANAGGVMVLANQCEAIATSMYDRSDSWGLRFTGASLTVYLSGDETRRKAARAEQIALAARASKNPPTSNCGFLRFQMRQTLREGQIGDLAAARERADAGDKR